MKLEAKSLLWKVSADAPVGMKEIAIICLQVKDVRLCGLRKDGCGREAHVFCSLLDIVLWVYVVIGVF